MGVDLTVFGSVLCLCTYIHCTYNAYSNEDKTIFGNSNSCFAEAKVCVPIVLNLLDHHNDVYCLVFCRANL